MKKVPRAEGTACAKALRQVLKDSLGDENADQRGWGGLRKGRRQQMKLEQQEESHRPREAGFHPKRGGEHGRAVKWEKRGSRGQQPLAVLRESS